MYIEYININIDCPFSMLMHLAKSKGIWFGILVNPS